MKPRSMRVFFAVGVMLLTGCDLFDLGLNDPEEKTKKVTIKGTVAVPDGPADVVVLSSTTNMAIYRFSCPKDGNRSGLQNGMFTLETMGSCADAQFVYFYDTSPRDLKSYTNGKITFKIQVNNTGSSYSFRLQDANAVHSAAVNITAFGFDPSLLAVDQLISIPVTAVTTPGFDFSKVDRLFQIDATCAATHCLTTFKDIKWTPSDTVASQSPLDVIHSYSPMALSRMPYCDPFPCRRLPKARVGIMKPSTSGWKAEPAVESVTTDQNGNFTILVDVKVLVDAGPVFIAVSDESGSYTLLSTIPDNLIKESAVIALPVDRATTAVGMMTCANGITIPSDGSGGWCIGDPISSTELETIYPAINVALNTTISVDITVFLPDVLDDAAAVAAINQLLTDNGQPAVTADVMLNANDNATFPIIVPPATPTTGGGGTTTVDPSNQCIATITCAICSIESCSNASADGTSCTGWYQASDGTRYNCTGNCGSMDCNAAAQAAMAHCCPPP